jgi:excisionase family DNA binding protein
MGCSSVLLCPWELLPPRGKLLILSETYCTLFDETCQYQLASVGANCATMIPEVSTMEDAAYSPPPGYLTMAQARVELGVSKPTLYRMVRAGRIATYRDQRNRRVRLMKVDDIARLMEPQPAEEGKAAA